MHPYCDMLANLFLPLLKSNLFFCIEFDQPLVIFVERFSCFCLGKVVFNAAFYLNSDVGVAESQVGNLT